MKPVLVDGSFEKEALTKKDEQRAKALQKIGVPEGEWLHHAQITPIWKNASGGAEAVIDALRSSMTEEARAFLGIYDRLSKTEKSVLKYEEIALAAGIKDILGFRTISIAAVCADTEDAAKLMLASSRPELIAASLAQAKTKRGFSDRELLLKASGTMPTPRGATVFINNAPPQQEPQQKWRSPDDRLRELHGDSPALPAPLVAVPDVIEAEYENLEIER
jgi:hypothetical protein